MKIQLIQATINDKETLQNLGRFYVYEMSRYCGFLPGWEVPADGLFECIDLSVYLKVAGNFPFLIKFDDELAGFVLVNKTGTSSDIDWNMAQFFVVSKFQRKGLGREIAFKIFDQFQGLWEVRQIPENKGAIDFWEKVIDRYTGGKFSKDEKTIEQPTPHQMIVMKFSTADKSLDEYKIRYKENLSAKEEAVLIDGIIFEANAKGMGKIQSFGFFIEDSKNGILAGVKGTTYYGCLYVDSLWVSKEHRHKKWGSQLMAAAEKLGRERNCTFATLTTMDWEARPFYQKLGYQIEYTREGYENNSKMYVLRKELK